MSSSVKPRPLLEYIGQKKVEVTPAPKITFFCVVVSIVLKEYLNDINHDYIKSRNGQPKFTSLKLKPPDSVQIKLPKCTVESSVASPIKLYTPAERMLLFGLHRFSTKRFWLNVCV